MLIVLSVRVYEAESELTARGAVCISGETPDRDISFLLLTFGAAGFAVRFSISTFYFVDIRLS